VVKPFTKKSISNSAKKPTPSPPQRAKKPTERREASEQESEQVEEIKPPKKRTPSKKREAPEQVPVEFEEVEEPRKKKLKKAMTPIEKYANFLQKSVVRGKVVKVDYFKEQGFGLFLDKLEAQGWLGLFTNTHIGCSVPDLADFYANCVVTKGGVTSTVNGHDLRFNAKELGEILGVPVKGFDAYV